MKRVYLDNAATSYPKPPEVWDAVLKAGRDDGANAGRSSYRTAEAAGGVLDDARVRLARLLGGEPNRVVLTLNATDALNIALKGFLRPDDHVITSIMEHNSVRRPLAGLERERRVRVTEVPADRLGRIGVKTIHVAVAGMCLFMCVQVMLILQWTALALPAWMLFGFFGASGILSYAALPQGFPPELAGRVITGLNVLTFAGAFAAQWGIGVVINLWPATGGGGYAPEGYQAAFAMMAMLQLLTLAWFLVFRKG